MTILPPSDVHKRIIALIIIGLTVYGLFFSYTRFLALEQERMNVPATEILPLYGSDAVGYLRIAENILEKKVFSLSENAPYIPDTFRTPGYPLFIAANLFAFGTHLSVPVIQIFLTIATGVLILLLGRNLFDEKIGFYAALLYLLDPTTILHTLVIASEALYIFTLFLSFYLLFGVRSGFLKEGTRVGLGGFLLGLSVLVRPISIFLLPLFALLYFVLNRKKPAKHIILSILALSLAFSVAVFPWVFRNKTVSGVWGMSSVNDFNFFHYNMPEFLSYKEGITPDEGRLKLRAEVSGLAPEDYVHLENSPRLAAVWHDVYFKNAFSYTAFHLFKTIPFFISSGVENVFAFHERVLGYPVFYKSRFNMTNALLKRDFAGLWGEVRNSPIVAVENIFWVSITFLALIPLFVKKHRGTSLILWAIIAYFAVATGLVAFCRFRMPVAPLVFFLALDGFFVFQSAVMSFMRRPRLLA